MCFYLLKCFQDIKQLATIRKIYYNDFHYKLKINFIIHVIQDEFLFF